LAAGPIPELRDPNQALRLAEKAQSLNPASKSAMEAKGAACYRLGRWAEAADAFEQLNRLNREAHAAGTPAATYLHAMALWNLGCRDQALSIYSAQSKTDRTGCWTENGLVRGEAEALLGIHPESPEQIVPQSSVPPKPI